MIRRNLGSKIMYNTPSDQASFISQSYNISSQLANLSLKVTYRVFVEIKKEWCRTQDFLRITNSMQYSCLTERSIIFESLQHH